MALWQSRSIQWCTQTLPCPCQAHTDDTWMTGRGQLRFPLVSTLSDFQDRLFRVFLIFFFRTDGNNVHTENLCTTSKMGLHAIGVNVFLSQQKYLLETRKLGSACSRKSSCSLIHTSWPTLPLGSPKLLPYSSLEAADLCLSHILLQNKQS